jgi:hypothetical protein
MAEKRASSSWRDEDQALRQLRGKLSGVLARLPAVERRVLELRMGLEDGTPAKPGETAERLGMTVAEVKRIEARAFERIREVGPVKGLERFLVQHVPDRSRMVGQQGRQPHEVEQDVEDVMAAEMPRRLRRSQT